MVIWAALTACTPEPPPAPPDPSPLRVHTLDNGLRITVLANPEPPGEASYELLVAAGSRHETIPGTAHFVEHLAFRASLQTGSLGPHENAHTSPDHTWFHVTDPGILRALAGGLDLAPGRIESERQVLAAELDVRGLEPGSRRMREALPRIDAEALGAFYETWYRPDRMEVLAVGDFDPDVTLTALSDALDDLAVSGPAPVEAPKGTGVAKEVLPSGGSEQLVSVTLPAHDVPRPAAEVLAAVLANRLGSRVEHEGGTLRVQSAALRAPPGLAERVLSSLGAAAPPTPREVETARDEVLLGWLERPFAWRPEETVVWREALHEARVAGAPLPHDPFADAEAARATVAAISTEEVAAAAREVLRWEPLSLTAAGAPPLPALEAAFRSGATVFTPPAPGAVPRDRSGELHTERVEPAATLWRLGGGGEVLYRRLDVPVVVVAARLPRVRMPDGSEPDVTAWPVRLQAHDPGTAWTASVHLDHVRIAGRLLPERLDVGLLRLADVLAEPDTVGLAGTDRLQVVLAGPLEVAGVAASLQASLAGVEHPGDLGFAFEDESPMALPPSRFGTRAMRSWVQPVAEPADLEALPVLVQALDQALPSARVVFERVHGGVRIMAVAPAMTDLDPPWRLEVPPRVTMPDPRDPDPTAWAATMLDRLDAWPSLSEAWEAPAVPPPDVEALELLTARYLP